MSGIVPIGLGVTAIIVLAETIRSRLRLKKSVKEDLGDFVQPLPPPAQLCPYEVFLSFRGEDTRNNFVSHLYFALKDRGIQTYFDETNLHKGQTIAIEIVKAIEESCIALVVLSCNYGSSTWCLNELVKIMECKNKSGLTVFPIFYNVSPSDVRWQENSFFAAFSNHEVNSNGMVKYWRNALKEVSDLAGEDIRGKNEASSIKKIADKILRQLPLKASKFRKSLVGIESRISELKKLMGSKPDEVIFIGLWGMGGIGKTTMARAIFEECKNNFEGSCFLQDVRKSNDRLEKLQQKLLSSILKTESKDICDVVEGSSMIQERLQFKKVLLVIDDVDDIEQLNVLAEQCDWFGRGSRIIITTRDAHLINEDHIEKYDVQMLSEREALHLFCIHAFKSDHPPEDYKELSLEVVRYAAGLPLALQVLGHHLYRRERCVWESTLSRLEDVPEDKIISKLQISFDGLNVLQQNIFLDIACYFRGYSKNRVEKRLESLGLHPKEGIDVLIQKSLIHISMEDHDYGSDSNDDDEDGSNSDEDDYGSISDGSNSDDDDYQDGCIIEMHDLLQDMGVYIVRQRSNWDIRRYSRLWLKKDILDVLSDITVSSEVEGICMGINLYFDYDDDFISVKLLWEGAFRNMNKLSFLELDGDFFKGKYNANVSQSFGQLDNKLRWFSLSKYPGRSLPKNFHPRNLVRLDMPESQMKETPDFSHMPNLEVLNLIYSYMLVHVHPSLGNHMKIKRINLAFCYKLKGFPKINRMESLEILNLSHTKFKSFPEIHGNLDALRKLKLYDASINGLPTSIVGSATALRELRLECHDRLAYHKEYKEGFTSLEVVADGFPRLVSLEISYSGIMRTLDFSHLPYLEELDLSGSKELVEVHPSLGVHKRIKSIKLSGCSKLEEFPRIVDMNSLENLDLSYTRLQNFPEMAGNVNRLVELRLDSTEITTLPWSIGRATSLEIIRMLFCKYLLTLPISFLHRQIRRIYISSEALKYFEENINDEDAVQQEAELRSNLRRRGKQLIGSKGMGLLSAVEIYFSYCQSLEELPDFLLSRVEFLVITECRTLTNWICFNLVDLLDKYQNLYYLQLHQGYDMNFLQAFSEWETISIMLRKREEFFQVCFPGRQIPSWFQYQISSSVTLFLPPLSEWYTDNLRGFVLSGINVYSTKIFIMSSDYIYLFDGHCCCPGKSHVLVIYIPIDSIGGEIRDWDMQKECTLFKLQSITKMVETSHSWGFSLVYSEGEVKEVDPHQVIIVTDDSSSFSTFRVKIAESRDMMEKLYSSNNPVSWALHEQQSHSKEGTLAAEHKKNSPHPLPLFPSGLDLTCYQEGGESASSICLGEDAWNEDLGLELHFNSQTSCISGGNINHQGRNQKGNEGDGKF